jgi:hypothetical protein
MPGVTKAQCLKNFLKEVDINKVTIIADNCSEKMIAYLNSQNFEKVIVTNL